MGCILGLVESSHLGLRLGFLLPGAGCYHGQPVRGGEPRLLVRVPYTQVYAGAALIGPRVLSDAFDDNMPLFLHLQLTPPAYTQALVGCLNTFAVF